MKQALSKLVLLPWALTVEMWRYNLFSGGIQEPDMIAKWWEFRKEFQGVDPPDLEGSLLFDPASKYHVALNIPYLRYFLSRFLEHHFLEALCSAAGHPLHDCCFVTSATAGKRLRSMLSLGASVSWQKALWVLTRERRLSSKPLLKYYKPLHDWLIQHNSANNITPSW
ncbi:hypothetical protein JTE90_010862 [Oedothorax gibbosus]|uniref:Angiotensin-converting enzyme n=1 Tax=Oedothorax gibbosus TaxID=931172 RepID=A0AAV6V4Z5_9ARAC|nr:hypothetical protein JTE90_010862 [Oedothorax gibbosus]